MNPLDDARSAAFMVICLAIGVPAVLFVLRSVLTIALRNRLPASHLPDILEPHRSDSLLRFLSLIGWRAEVPETLGLRRLQSTLGLKLLVWGVTVLVATYGTQMQNGAMGPMMLFAAFAACFAVHATVYEISYDRDTITLPRWWFGRTTRNWRDLDAMVEGRGWYMHFHFRDGQVIQAHKYIVGYAALKETARRALREA